MRTFWLTMAAVAAALAMAAGASAVGGNKGGGSDGCRGGYGPVELGLSDPLAQYDTNGNGFVCVYLGANDNKADYIDDNAKPLK